MVTNMEDILKLLKKMGVRSAEVMNGELIKVEFFPEAANDDIEKKPREDEKINPATGLTRQQTQDILNMDE